MSTQPLVPGAAAQLLLEWAGAEISPVTRQLAQTVVALEADLMTLLSYHVVPCVGDSRRPDRWTVPGMPELWKCVQPLAFRVTWSDRTVYCCPFHLGAVRWAAANDSTESRTDDPFVEPYALHPPGCAVVDGSNPRGPPAMTPAQLRLYRAASQVVAEWVLRATRMPSAAALNELTEALESIEDPPPPELRPMGSGHYSLSRGSPRPPTAEDLAVGDVMTEWLVFTPAPVQHVEVVYLLNLAEGIYQLRTGPAGSPEATPWKPPAGARYWPWKSGEGPTLWPSRTRPVTVEEAL